MEDGRAPVDDRLQIDGVSERSVAIYTIANDPMAEVRLIEPGE
jgi:hypothetical protein